MREKKEYQSNIGNLGEILQLRPPSMAGFCDSFTGINIGTFSGLNINIHNSLLNVIYLALTSTSFHAVFTLGPLTNV